MPLADMSMRIADQSFLKPAVIISVYRDSIALDLLLYALTRQSYANFLAVVSEDGEDPAIAAVVGKYKFLLNLMHVTQEDVGFRKNRALNRAVVAAGRDYCIFLDGDCIPHRHFVRNHLRNAAQGYFLAGRRVRLGPRSSTALRNDPRLLLRWEKPFYYLLTAHKLLTDKTRNYELGFVSHWSNRIIRDRDTHIIGCNFSLPRSALETVNGFNEAFTSPGIGEDCDLEWRLRATGHSSRNVRACAVVYHLHHPRTYTISDENRELTGSAQNANRYCCEHGLDQYR